MKKKMLLAVPLFLAVAHTAYASPGSAVRCRVGNGKGVVYHDNVHACLKARAEGQKVEFEKGEDPDAKKKKASET